MWNQCSLKSQSGRLTPMLPHWTILKSCGVGLLSHSLIHLFLSIPTVTALGKVLHLFSSAIILHPPKLSPCSHLTSLCLILPSGTDQVAIWSPPGYVMCLFKILEWILAARVKTQTHIRPFKTWPQPPYVASSSSPAVYLELGVAGITKHALSGWNSEAGLPSLPTMLPPPLLGATLGPPLYTCTYVRIPCLFVIPLYSLRPRSLHASSTKHFLSLTARFRYLFLFFGITSSYLWLNSSFFKLQFSLHKLSFMIV